MQFCGPLITSLAYVELLSLFNDLCGCSIIIHSVVLSHDYDIQNSLIFNDAWRTPQLAYVTSRKKGQGAVYNNCGIQQNKIPSPPLSLYLNP
jgi:hypothetical protein